MMGELIDDDTKSHLASFSLLIQDQRFDLKKNWDFLLKKVVSNNNIDMAKIILEQERSFPVQSDILVYALHSGCVDFVELLLSKKIGQLNDRVIVIACKKQYVKIVQLLLDDPRIDPSVNNNFVIMWASQYGHIEVVKTLLADPRVDPSAGDNAAIGAASANGHIEVVKILLADPRVNPNTYDNYAMHSASSHGHAEVVKILLADPRVNPNAADNCVINYASANGHAEVVRLLLGDPRITFAQDYRCVEMALKNGHVEIVKLLLADHRVQISKNHEVSHLLLKSGNAEIVQLLKRKIGSAKKGIRQSGIDQIKDLMNQNGIITIDISHPYLEFTTGPSPAVTKLDALSTITEMMKVQNITKIVIIGEKTKLILG